jgi:hypothetical protein
MQHAERGWEWKACVGREGLNPIEILWSSYGSPMEVLWNNTHTTSKHHTNMPGYWQSVVRRGTGELAELRSLPKQAAVEGLAQWAGRGWNAEEKIKAPAWVFDRALGSLPDPKLPDEPNLLPKWVACKWLAGRMRWPWPGCHRLSSRRAPSRQPAPQRGRVVGMPASTRKFSTLRQRSPFWWFLALPRSPNRKPAQTPSRPA